MNGFKHNFHHWVSIVYSLVFLIISINCCPAFADSGGGEPNVEITWAETTNGTYHVFYTAQNDNHVWSPKIKLSKSYALNVAPAISSGSDGNTWIVWSSVKGAASQLEFSYFDGVRWSDPEEIQTANLTSNTGVSILIDKLNMPWITWAGFDGKDDDIYFSRWDGETWETPIRVNKDNETPDILPILRANEDNLPSIYWSGFNGDSYSKYVSRWTGDGWSDKEIIDHNEFRAILCSEEDLIPALPNFVKEPGKASVHIRKKGKLQSIPLRELHSN